MNELNPNHPVVVEMRDQWHKLCAFALFILGSPDLEITSADIEEFQHALGGNITLRLVNGQEAEKLAREEGGLPV